MSTARWWRYVADNEGTPASANGSALPGQPDARAQGPRVRMVEALKQALQEKTP